MAIKILNFSYKFGKEIIDTKGTISEELNNIIFQATSSISDLSRPNLNQRLEMYLLTNNWSHALNNKSDIEFYKDNIMLKIRTGHPSFIGSDLLNFELAMNKDNQRIDASVYIVVTSNFKKRLIDDYGVKWEGSLTYDKSIKEMNKYKSIIHAPILLVGIDVE